MFPQLNLIFHRLEFLILVAKKKHCDVSDNKAEHEMDTLDEENLQLFHSDGYSSNFEEFESKFKKILRGTPMERHSDCFNTN